MSIGRYNKHEVRLGKCPNVVIKPDINSLTRIDRIIYPDRPGKAFYSERSRNNDCWVIKINDDGKGMTERPPDDSGFVCMVLDRPGPGEVICITEDRLIGRRKGEVGTMQGKNNDEFVPRHKNNRSN